MKKLLFASLLPSLSMAATQPNVIVIITDQQRAEKVGFLNLEPVKTPSMDYIGKSGYTFANAFCTFPLSVPSRFAMFTGMYPSEGGVRENILKYDVDKIEAHTMGTLFRNAGYDTWYGGKLHLPGCKGDAKPYGFSGFYSNDKHEKLGQAAGEVLDSLSKTDKPFLLVASFINPHDIMAFDADVKKANDQEQAASGSKETRERGSRYYTRTSKTMDEKSLPKLVANSGPTEGMTVDVPGYAPAFTEREWRMRRWVYDRLTEDADWQIEQLVNSIRNNKLLENTIVVFLSDHGDMDGAHGMELKRAPYNECQKVPVLIAGPGIKTTIDKSNVVNTGVDLLPTLCDLAGIAIPAGMQGRSLKPLLTGASQKIDRDAIFCESDCWFQVIWQGRYKYTLLETKGLPGMLVDLEKDPGEMVNLVADPRYKEIKEKLSSMLLKELDRRGIKPNSEAVLNAFYKAKFNIGGE